MMMLGGGGVIAEIVKVGVVLDLTNGTVGKIGLRCIKMSLSDFYLSHSHSYHKTTIQLIVRDSLRDVVTAGQQGNSLMAIAFCMYEFNDLVNSQYYA